MGLQLLYGAALFGASVQAIAFPGPRPTDVFEARPFNGWTPRPTPAPVAHPLLRRQLNLPETYLVAPDNTCGFINGSPKSAYACVDDDKQCAFIPSSGKAPGAAGCCKGKDCDFRVDCFGKADMNDCDKDCQADAQTLKCTDAAKFCGTVAFPGGVVDYYCATKKTSMSAQTATSGDKSRSMSTVKPTSSSTSTKKTSSSSTSRSSSSSTTSSSSSSSSSSSTSSETSSSSTQSTTTSATDTAAAGAATSTAPVASDAPSPPTGPIVGGVVGGVALISLIAVGALCLRRNRKKYAEAEMPPPQPFMAEPTLPPTQPPPDPYAQNSAASRMSYAPPSHGMPSASATPAQMYAAPAAAAAVAGAGAAGAFAAYHNQHNNNGYPDPSPMTTPSGSPGQQHYAHQFHAPQPLPPPSYYNHSPRPSDGSGGMIIDPPDRRDTSTPVSTYNGTIPVTPASALGPMPGEQQHQQQQGMGMGGAGVPLSLQPGMGYRPYRPGSAAVTVSTVSAAGSGSGSGMGVRAVSGSPSPPPSVPPAAAEGQGLGITGQTGPVGAGGRNGAVELP